MCIIILEVECDKYIRLILTVTVIVVSQGTITAVKPFISTDMNLAEYNLVYRLTPTYGHKIWVLN